VTILDVDLYDSMLGVEFDGLEAHVLAKARCLRVGGLLRLGRHWVSLSTSRWRRAGS